MRDGGRQERGEEEEQGREPDLDRKAPLMFSPLLLLCFGCFCFAFSQFRFFCSFFFLSAGWCPSSRLLSSCVLVFRFPFFNLLNSLFSSLRALFFFFFPLAGWCPGGAAFPFVLSHTFYPLSSAASSASLYRSSNCSAPLLAALSPSFVSSLHCALNVTYRGTRNGTDFQVLPSSCCFT